MQACASWQVTPRLARSLSRIEALGAGRLWAPCAGRRAPSRSRHLRDRNLDDDAARHPGSGDRVPSAAEKRSGQCCCVADSGSAHPCQQCSPPLPVFAEGRARKAFLCRQRLRGSLTPVARSALHRKPEEPQERARADQPRWSNPRSRARQASTHRIGILALGRCLHRSISRSGGLCSRRQREQRTRSIASGSAPKLP